MTTLVHAARAGAGDAPAADEAIRARGLLGFAGVAWLAVAALVLAWPDTQDLERTGTLGAIALVLGGGLLVAAVLAGVWARATAVSPTSVTPPQAARAFCRPSERATKLSPPCTTWA